jgi:hypothetical protein
MPRSIARLASTCAPDGGADGTGQDRRGLGERVGRRRVVVALEPAQGQQPSHARADRGEDPSQVLIARRGRGVKGEVARMCLAEDAVERERGGVHVELRAAPEASDHRVLGVTGPAGLAPCAVVTVTETVTHPARPRATGRNLPRRSPRSRETASCGMSPPGNFAVTVPLLIGTTPRVTPRCA